MIVDTTLSTADKCISKNAHRVLRNERRSFSGGCPQRPRKFRDWHVREFLEANGLDSDIDLRSTVVFWKDGAVVGVFSGGDSVSDRSQNIAALLA